MQVDDLLESEKFLETEEHAAGGKHSTEFARPGH